MSFKRCHCQILLQLLVLAPLSLVQFFALARLTGPTLIDLGVASLAAIRLPAFLVSIGLLLLVARDGLGLPRRPDRPALVWGMTGAVLVTTYLLVFWLRLWVPQMPATADIVVFIGTGLLAEEFWFRGMLFSLFTRITRSDSDHLSILFTSGLYALSHWQYHGFQFTPAAVIQLAYTLPLGLVLAMLRSQTLSVWPAVGLHLAVNLIVLARLWI